jgi:hypothetical protein
VAKTASLAAALLPVVADDVAAASVAALAPVFATTGVFSRASVLVVLEEAMEVRGRSLLSWQIATT